MNHKLIGIGRLWQPESNPSCGWLRGRRAANNGDRRSGGEGEGQRDASGDATVTQRCVSSAPSVMAARACVSGFTRDDYVTSFGWGEGGIAHSYRHVAPPLISGAYLCENVSLMVYFTFPHQLSETWNY